MCRMEFIEVMWWISCIGYLYKVRYYKHKITPGTTNDYNIV